MASEGKKVYQLLSSEIATGLAAYLDFFFFLWRCDCVKGRQFKEPLENFTIIVIFKWSEM